MCGAEPDSVRVDPTYASWECDEIEATQLNDGSFLSIFFSVTNTCDDGRALCTQVVCTCAASLLNWRRKQ
jgi:hypothetical protein